MNVINSPLNANNYKACAAAVKTKFNVQIQNLTTLHENCIKTQPCYNGTDLTPTLIPNITNVINQLNALKNQTNNQTIDPDCLQKILTNVDLLLTQSKTLSASILVPSRNATYSTLYSLVLAMENNVGVVAYNLTQCPLVTTTTSTTTTSTSTTETPTTTSSNLN
jgi:hypothetical protein